MLNTKQREVRLRMKRDRMNPSLERWHRAASEARRKHCPVPQPRGSQLDASQLTLFCHPHSSATAAAHAYPLVSVETLAALGPKRI
jgi:hypothetical protein